MAKLILQRKKECIGLFIPLHVSVDGKDAAIIHYGKQVELELTEGKHQVMISDPGQGNNKFVVCLKEKEIKKFVLAGHRGLTLVNVRLIFFFFAAMLADYILSDGNTVLLLSFFNLLAMMTFLFCKERLRYFECQA